MIKVVSLEGEWGLVLDPWGEGKGPDWLTGHEPRSVILPGSLDAQGIGEAVSVDTSWTATIFDRAFYEAAKFERYREAGNVKVPFCLQPDTKFVGVAWYRRSVEVPVDWEGGRARLYLERPHWATQVWLDEAEMGKGDSLSVAHCFDLGVLEAGLVYWITIRIDNRMCVEVGENAHSVSDHTQGNWNGIVGAIQLRGESAVAGIESLAVVSTSVKGALLVRGAGDGVGVTLRVFEVGDRGRSLVLTRSLGQGEIGEDGRFEASLECGGQVRLWDEFAPHLYVLEAVADGVSWEVEFGFREFTIEGSQFAINGRRLFLRGALDCCVFPETGHPPMDVASWERIFSRIKECGFNHVRFHSWCPPEAAFVAGDRLGVYLQVECAVWPNAEAVLGFNSPKGIGDGAGVDLWAIREGERILEAYGHHPSFVMFACGNEPGGSHHREYLSAWVEHFRSIDFQRVITGSAGWPALAENQFHVVPDPRIHQWGDGLKCRLNGRAPNTLHDYQAFVDGQDRPVVSHEIGQWCAFPGVTYFGKYVGHLKPRNYEVILESLAAQGLAEMAWNFEYASGKLQALCYKEEIESSLRTRGLAGFQLLGLQDFPGQGTAPVGLLDAFWEKKSYCAFGEIKRFCDSTVVLARLEKRVFAKGETLEASIEVAHYGERPLRGEELQWSLVGEDGAVWQQSRFAVEAVGIGLSELGRFAVDLSAVGCAVKMRLVVRLSVGEGFAENDWDVWVYPNIGGGCESDSVRLVSKVEDALEFLGKGETVLLASNQVANEVALGFTPIFWNTACTQGQAPHTLGILCDPHHLALQLFPTDSFTNWQWWYLLQGAGALQLDGLPAGLEPIVRVIDDWADNRKLGLLFEARVGEGKLMVCSADLLAPASSFEETLVRNQFKASLVRYMTSVGFEPKSVLSAISLEAVFRDCG